MSAPSGAKTAQQQRHANLRQFYKQVLEHQPFEDFASRRMFASELLFSTPDMPPRTAEFLGKTMFDRNTYSEKQIAWLRKLTDAFFANADAPTEAETLPEKGRPKSAKT